MTAPRNLLAALLLPLAAALQAEPIVYAPLAGAIDNPERGFYSVGSGNGSLADLSTDYGFIRSQGVTLVYGRLNLEPYAATALPPSYLGDLSAGFGLARAAGLKAIVRVVYNDGFATPNPPTEATLGQTRAHLQQLQPIFEANKDVILLFQAGIVGAWGEWHSTDQYRDPLEAYADNNVPTPAGRRSVVDALLEYTPANRFIQVRRPWFKDPDFGAEALFPGEQVDAATAFTSLGVARVGHHNDCFLASNTDFGTYQGSGINAQKNFLAEDTRFVPMGGETCNPDIDFANCTRALDEMARFHYSYLNLLYHPDVLSEFRNSGCFDEINRRLGYRFELVSADLPTTVQNGVAANFTVTIRNVGFAAAINQRPVYLLVLDGATIVAQVEVPGADPRRWLPGADHAHSGSFTVSGVAPGATLSAALWLPDPEPALQQLPAYSIRLASENVWQPATGRNVLTDSITVGPTATVPDAFILN